MAPDDKELLGQAQRRLSDAADRLAGDVLGLDDSRSDCLRLADRYQGLALRMADGYPSLAGPAAAIAQLCTQLHVQLGRLNLVNEELVAASGRLADRVARLNGTL
jgi:hypothetical protein